MTDRLFTLAEAQELVPWLQKVFDEIEPLKADLAQAQKLAQELVTRMRSNGGPKASQELDESNRSQKVAQDRIDELVLTVHDRDIVVRSVEQGLVDFPSDRWGRTVYLCWLAGEREITQWHEMDTGFASRQPL